MSVFFFLIVTLLASFFFVGCLVKYAPHAKLLDVPNVRSSHQIPTPLGGGIIIVVVVIGGWAVLYNLNLIPKAQFWGMFGASILVGFLGLLDDFGNLSVRWRLIGHFLAAIWFLSWVGGLPPLVLSVSHVDLSWVGHALAVFYLVWLLNLYNFMDGIDGIAGAEAVTSLSVSTLLIFLLGEGSWLLPLLIIMAVMGFLVWNWPPARIFMGDSGSCFLGLVLGMISVLHAQEHPKLLWCWIILMGVFITDATLTLIRRILRKQIIYEAHCSHAYQYASRTYKSHHTVTLGIIVINLFWLSPWATMVVFEKIDTVWALLISYFPLVVLAFRFKAGAPELQENY